MQLISIGELIDQSWENYRSRFPSFVKIIVWQLVPCFFSIIALILYPNAATMLAGRAMNITETSSVFIWFFSNSILTPIIGLWVFIATVRLLLTQMEKKPVIFSKISKEGWKLFLPTLWVSALVSFFIIAIWFILTPGIFFDWLGGTLNSSILGTFGALLIIAGSIAAAILTVERLVNLAYAPLALIIENIHGRQALKRSRELVKGKFWVTLFRMVIPKVPFIFATVVILSILTYLIQLLVTSTIGLNVDLATRVNSILSSLLLTIGLSLLNPILIITDFLLFDSLRKNK